LVFAQFLRCGPARALTPQGHGRPKAGFEMEIGRGLRRAESCGDEAGRVSRSRLNLRRNVAPPAIYRKKDAALATPERFSFKDFSLVFCRKLVSKLGRYRYVVEISPGLSGWPTPADSSPTVTLCSRRVCQMAAGKCSKPTRPGSGFWPAPPTAGFLPGPPAVGLRPQFRLTNWSIILYFLLFFLFFCYSPERPRPLLGRLHVAAWNPGGRTFRRGADDKR